MMPDSRALPISPAHREFTIKVGGEAVPREHQLLSARISTVVNRIASARLVYLDGSASSGGFPLSNADVFTPGKEVEVSAGNGNDVVSLFKGIVVRQSAKVRDNSAPQLVIECRHAAMKLAAVRRNASYFDEKDSDVLKSLLGAAGVPDDVESTSVTHKQLVQFHTSDWDFLLARAQANGMLVWADGDKIAVKAPAVGASQATLEFGATLLELDAEIDARRQYKAVRGISWDPAQQAMIEADASPPSLSGAGNLAPDDLAGVEDAERLELRHAALSETEAKAWAEGAWLLSRINKVSGRVKCEGIATIKTGGVVTLAGVGDRINGPVFITGVLHEADLVQGWKTHVQFGGVESVPAAETRSSPPAGNLLARVAGLQIGVVVSNEDPDGEHRVRVRMPMVSNEDDGIWARVASPDAGADRGFFFRPEIGDEVILGFLDEDPRHAVILGMLHSSAKAAPLEGSDDNHEKVYQTRAGMRLYFNDDKKVIQIDTPSGNSITLSEDDKSLILADQNSNKITMNADGISIESQKAVTIKAGTDLTVESVKAFGIKGGTELKLEGTSQAELSSSAITKVTGSLVQIN
jgi:Rhs element Vgr protein